MNGTPQEKQGLSAGAKWGIGCGIGCIVIVIICLVVMFFSFRYIAKVAREAQAERQAEVAAMREDLRVKGFENEIKGQVLSIEQDIHTPTIYDAQVFKLYGTCTTNLCVLAQVCEIYGTVKGDLIFRGQVLTIATNAVVAGKLDVDAQRVNQYGEVRGGTSGEYQVMENQ